MTQQCPSPEVGDVSIPSHRTWAIFLVSVLGLFLELLLIRWIGTEIRIFAYLQNTVLVVCFLGLGMGCFTSRRPIELRRQLLLPLLVLMLIMAIPISRRGMGHISELLSVLGDMHIWHAAVSQNSWQTMSHVALGLGLTFMLMVLLWSLFVPIGRLLGRLLDDHPHTIWAYSVNIAGSLLGIWLFVALSACGVPPVGWFAVFALLVVVFVGAGWQRLGNVGMLLLIVGLAWQASSEPGAIETTWSPYQKLALRDSGGRNMSWDGLFIEVNNVGYQEMLDLSWQGVRNNPQIDPGMYGLSQYDIPLLLQDSPQRVLIVGAGTGNDAAGALRGGASHITAVEIDSAIIDFGKRFHPERPYDSPRVQVVADDARSFFATTEERYDLIIFGLLDSHTTTAMTNARLDHYVYTKESLARAKALLAEGGVMCLSFEAEKPYIADRVAGTIRQVFGSEPLTFRVPPSRAGWGGVMFVAGDERTIQQSLAAHPRLARQIEVWQESLPVEINYSTSLAADDWPYIYLQYARIPTLYWLLGGLMIGLFAYGSYRLQTPINLLRWQRSHWHFFFLGAAFLLLEVQSISKVSVVLGNTWMVNAVIISGILSMILAANLIAARWPRQPLGLVTSCLLATCSGLYFVDLSTFASFPYATKALIVGALTTLPMLFAGVLFIRSFAIVNRKDLALGANLLGALVGALLQTVTFVTGIKALLLIVAALYTAAMLTRPKGAGATEWQPLGDDEYDEYSRPVAKRSDPSEEFAEPFAV
jgi:spermidine synthase